MYVFDFFKYKPEPNESFELTFAPDVCKTHIKNLDNEFVTENIDHNFRIASKILQTDINGDIIVRWFELNFSGTKERGFVISVDGLANVSFVNDFLLEPLMDKELPVKSGFKDISVLINSVVPQRQVVYEKNIKKLADSVNFGNAAFFVNGFQNAVIIDVKTWEHRTVSSPVNETVVQGPHEAFNEVLRCNTALIRKSINNSNLIMETMLFGTESKTPASLAYINGVINNNLIREIKNKLELIDAKYVLSVFDIEKKLEERPFLSMPQLITTERPDKVSRALIEGRAALILNGSSHALIMPSNITDIIASPEDSYLRQPYAVFIKLIRILAVILSVLTPGLFLALTGFHSDAILTDMLLSLNSAARNVPFSPLTEVIIMEIAFELIKEASVRVPGAIGSSLGIVGGLILGQSAVSAGVVSPIVIIIVSVCGIASFAIPSYSLSFSFRISRFMYIIAGALLGLIGILGVLAVHLELILSTKSFGVPSCVPFSPKTSKYPIFHALFDSHYNVNPPEYMNSSTGGDSDES